MIKIIIKNKEEKNEIKAGFPDGLDPWNVPIRVMNEILEQIYTILNEKKDRCYRKAKRKFKVFPSRYAGAYISKCRKGKIKK